MALDQANSFKFSMEFNEGHWWFHTEAHHIMYPGNVGIKGKSPKSQKKVYDNASNVTSGLSLEWFYLPLQ